MNKLFKYILIGIGITSLGFASVKADYLDGLTYIGNINSTNTNNIYTTTFGNVGYPDETSLFCIYVRDDSNIQYTLSVGSASNIRLRRSDFGCFYYEQGSQSASIVISNINGNGGVVFDFDIYKLNTNFNITSGNPGYTSLQCQTEYNLIPVSEVTANYCALNFGMIDPQECPINSGTGAIVRSNLMINDVPYAQNQNINVFIPDFLAWNISFNDLYTVIEVEGYDADTEYIENVINKEKLTPTPEEFGKLLQGLVNFIPYLFIGLLILYFVKVLNKVWK